MSDKLKKRSKALSYWLRHAPKKGDITLDANGWASVEAIQQALLRKGLETDADLLAQVVQENDKQRFEFSPDGLAIRARQGHSVAVEGAWETAEPPGRLFHGTVEKFMEAIGEQGLTKQNRHHVHLSPDLETASKVGERHGKPVILVVDAKAMRDAGIEFALSANGVWLTDRVAPQYFSRFKPA